MNFFKRFVARFFGKKNSQKVETQTTQKKHVAHNKGKHLFRFEDGYGCFAFTLHEAIKKHEENISKNK